MKAYKLALAQREGQVMRTNSRFSIAMLVLLFGCAGPEREREEMYARWRARIEAKAEGERAKGNCGVTVVSFGKNVPPEVEEREQRENAEKVTRCIEAKAQKERAEEAQRAEENRLAEEKRAKSAEEVRLTVEREKAEEVRRWHALAVKYNCKGEILPYVWAVQTQLKAIEEAKGRCVELFVGALFDEISPTTGLYRLLSSDLVLVYISSRRTSEWRPGFGSSMRGLYKIKGRFSYRNALGWMQIVPSLQALGE